MCGSSILKCFTRLQFRPLKKTNESRCGYILLLRQYEMMPWGELASIAIARRCCRGNFSTTKIFVSNGQRIWRFRSFDSANSSYHHRCEHVSEDIDCRTCQVRKAQHVFSQVKLLLRNYSSLFSSILESLSCWWMAISRASTSARSSMDLIAKWIRYVSVMSTMALNVNNPHVMPVIQIPVSAIKRFCRRNKMRTQKDLIEPYSGPSSNRFAAVLNTMIVSVLYSSGISLMLFTCSLTLMFTRVFDKIALLRLYRYPPMMDQTLGEYAVSIMKWAVFVHCAMALWIYSYPATLSSETPMPQNR